MAISVAIFLAAPIRCEASENNVAIFTRVAISWLIPKWLFLVAIFVAIRGYFMFFAWLFLRGYFLRVATFRKCMDAWGLMHRNHAIGGDSTPRPR